MNLQDLNGGTFSISEMSSIIEEFDMFTCETDGGVAVALTDQITDGPLPDCGEFTLDGETNLFTFKLYKQ